MPYGHTNQVIDQNMALPLMLANALEQTLANPSACHRWHTLGALYAVNTEATHRDLVLDVLSQYSRTDGEVGFFYATFLTEYTRDPKYRALAGSILQAIEPFDSDRLMAFCVYEWGCQVLGQGSRQEMADTLRTAQVPETIARIGKSLNSLMLPDTSVSPRGNLTSLRRVAIVSPYISGMTHPPTALALQHARLLSEVGVQAHVFSAQELRVNHMANYLGSNGQLIIDPPDLLAMRPHLAPGVNLTVCDERFSVARRSQDLLQAIVTFDPDVVLFVGMFSSLMWPLYNVVPSLGLCMHAMQPMAAVDAWLTSDHLQGGRETEFWGPAVPSSLGIYHPQRIALKPISHPVTRAALNLPDAAVVLISAGSRLDSEITGEWAIRMQAWLRAHPNVVWLLVGGKAAHPPMLDTTVGSTPIRLINHQEDLRSVLRCADIYVNPERVGGGFSVAEAMAEGLAVVALPQGDGGDKLGNDASPTLDAYFEQLSALAADSEARKNMGVRLKRRFTDTLDLTASGPALLAACHTACERFVQRETN